MIRSTSAAGILLGIILAVSTQPVQALVRWDAAGGRLTVVTPAYRFSMNAQTGAPVSMSLGDQEVLRLGHAGWWTLTFEDGHTLDASACEANIQHSADELNCHYSSPAAHVDVSTRFEEKAITVSARVSGLQAPAKGFDLCGQMTFRPNTIHAVYFPEELGRALLPPFFEARPADSPAGWGHSPLGARGAQMVGIIPTDMRDYNEPPVPASVTQVGKDWLGSSAVEMAGWVVRCPRPPATAPDVVILSTPSGPLLSMERLGKGWGWFVRWGGVFGSQDTDRVQTASLAVVRALWNQPITSGSEEPAPANDAGKPRRLVMPKSIGIISCESAAAGQTWQKSLAPLGCPFVEINSPASLMKHLAAQDCWLMVNADSEVLPATEDNAQATANAIRGYVAHGGIWLHTGAAAFFYALQPEKYCSVQATYPPAFSDFIHLDSVAGQLSLFGVRDPASIFVPVALSASGTADGGMVTRQWITWINPGETWQSPRFRMQAGLPVAQAIRAYGDANGLIRPLTDKVKPAVLARLKESVLLKLAGGAYKERADICKDLPSPILVHDADYLHGGFDKQYPDDLPPAASKGTPEEFANSIKAAHANGDLYMPYTNPTWWCDDPPGPTFVAAGQAPLAKDRAGKPIREQYAANWGWALCAFHPAALAAEKHILESFTRDYPADILFQDQIGARGPRYDFNPASPTPYAYTQGMMDIARRDSKLIPLGTEDGFDGVMNEETLFCGIVWGLVPTPGPTWRQLWQDIYPSDTWRFAPLALWLAHDRSIFTMHDLGQFVMNRQILSWVMALGYEISYVATPSYLQNPQNRQWLDWLAAVQKAVGPQVLGERLTTWTEPTPGVYAARYGGIKITADTTEQPYTVRPGVIISAYGFLAESAAGPGHVMAGIVDQYDGMNYPGGIGIVIHDRSAATYAPAGTKIVLPGIDPVTDGTQPVPSVAMAGGVEFSQPSPGWATSEGRKPGADSEPILCWLTLRETP